MHVNAPQVVSRHNGNQVMFERDLYYVFNGPFAVTFCLLMKTAMHAGRVVSVIGQEPPALLWTDVEPSPSVVFSTHQLSLSVSARGPAPSCTPS